MYLFFFFCICTLFLFFFKEEHVFFFFPYDAVVDGFFFLYLFLQHLEMACRLAISFSSTFPRTFFPFKSLKLHKYHFCGLVPFDLLCTLITLMYILKYTMVTSL